MHWLLLAVVGTLAVSFVCSLLYGVVANTTMSEVEDLKDTHPKAAQLLEHLKLDLDPELVGLVVLNTTTRAVGTAFGAVLALKLFGLQPALLLLAGYIIALVFVGEVIPKQVGATYRLHLQTTAAPLVNWIHRLMKPITWLGELLVRPLRREEPEIHKSDEEIILLAERGAQEGTLSKSESSIIANALSLDDVRVSEIMTPRTVVTALRKSATVGEVFLEHPNIPFARIPVYNRNVDDVVGLVRRRDLLKAKANDLDFDLVEKLMQEVHFIPETVTVANALQVFLKTHQQLLVAVDEFGATAGVVTMEDVMEHLIGREIFEKDDMAVDMRELARSKIQKQARSRRADTPANPGKSSPS